ncbi:hypothetical protein [Streptomyces sp. NPDC059018]
MAHGLEVTAAGGYAEHVPQGSGQSGQHPAQILRASVLVAEYC